MFKKLFALLLATLAPFSLSGAEGTQKVVLKVTVLASGRIFLDGKESNLKAVDEAFKKLKGRKGSVWYYREAGNEEPPPEAMKVMELMVNHRLPVSLSSKPDFSDYIDQDGVSHPRP